MKRNRIVGVIVSVVMLMSVLPIMASAAIETNTISANSDISAVIDANNSLWMWGDNQYGQLGNGTMENSAYPIKIMDDVVSISCSERHSAAIKTDGSLWMWGVAGLLGNGSEGNLEKDNMMFQTIPIKIMDNVASVSCNGLFTAAIKTDGSLWMWGDNRNGQLGNGTTENAKYPIKIMDDVISVSCGSWGYTAAIKSDNSLWMWGDNQKSQLGNGGEGNIKVFGHSSQSVPIKIMDDVSFVSCGGAHTAVIKNDGSLWIWGWNSYGQLGNETKKVSTVPIKITDDVIFVNCGKLHTAAIKNDNSLWMWGYNKDGQLGNNFVGNTTTGIYGSINGGQPDDNDIVMSVPVKIMDNVLSAKCGGCHTVIEKKDGTVWTCGLNRNGQLGVDITTDTVNNYGAAIQTTPIKLPNLTAKPHITVTVNGKPIDFDQSPTIMDGRTLVPIRAIFEILGATVDWNGETQTVTSKKESTSITLTIDSKTMYKNGKAVMLDVPAQLIGNRTLVPARAVAEAFGCNVDWDNDTKTVIITD